MMSQESSLTKELEAYERMRNSLETEHIGKWVVVHDEVVVGYYDSFEDAAAEAVKNFGRGPYLIRQVGEGPMKLPASVLYAPANLYADN